MKRDGFTIIEVMIFLAISGLMLAMAVIGSGNLARQARFSDSINSFHSTLQRQYEEVVNGVNTRQDSDAGCVGGAPQQPGTDSCILLGKVISFSPLAGRTIKIRYVTDDPNPPYNATGTVLDQIQDAGPVATDTGMTTYELSWGAEFQTAYRKSTVTAGDPPASTKSGSPAFAKIANIAFLRSPNGSQIIPYYFYSASDALNAVNAGLTRATADPLVNPPADTSGSTGIEAYICIVNKQEWGANGPAAAIVLGGGQGAAAIDTKFEPTRSDVTPGVECDA